MSRRRSKTTKPRAQKSRIEELQAQADQSGVPMFLPTEERARRGHLAIEQISSWAPQGDPIGSKAPRRVSVGVAIKDLNSGAAVRLRRFKGLTWAHIQAGVRFEKDWEASGLEPRMIANLLGTGGGSQGGIAGPVIDARTRVHIAMTALRTGGAEVVGVVEAILIHGATSTDAGLRRYADHVRHNAHVAAVLEIGLELLAGSYGIRIEEKPSPKPAQNLQSA